MRAAPFIYCWRLLRVFHPLVCMHEYIRNPVHCKEAYIARKHTPPGRFRARDVIASAHFHTIHP